MEVNNPASVSLSYELVQDPQGSTTIMEEKSSDVPPHSGDATSEDDDENKKRLFRRSSSSFMRVSDLQLPQQQSSQHHGDEKEPHYHHASDQPPPGMAYKENETWIALDDGVGSNTPVAPFAIDALFERGLKIATDEKIWVPDKATKKLLRGGTAPPLQSDQVLIWTCEQLLCHGVYGYDIPAVRSRGYIHMTPESLISLLVDSSRVQKYNKLSLGRTDQIIFNDNLHVSTGKFANTVTKVVKSSNKLPLIPKILHFCTLLHCRKLNLRDHGIDGFIIVSRAVTSSKASTDNNCQNEILLGVNLITRLEERTDWSVLTNVNHMKSPMVPGFIARRIGLSAAVSFIQDIRALC